MIILGISYLSDAGACIVKDGELKSVINEERLNRIKLFHGIPEMSVEYVLKDCGLKINDVDFIATHGFCANEKDIEFLDHGLIRESQEREGAFLYTEEKIKKSELNSALKELKLKELKERYEHENFVIYVRNINIIRGLRKFGKPIKVIEHHIGHAASAYFLSGWNECCIMTADGWGEMESNIFCHAKDGKIRKLYYSHSFDSLGYFYGSITKALGFIPHRHEGKVLGLSALGDSKKAMPWMKKMIYYNPNKKRFEGGFENGIYRAKFENSILESLVKKYKREDVAAAAQKVLEKVVIKYVNDVVAKGSKLAVAGGIFANVLLNQRIFDSPRIKDLFVYPQMGDGGLAVGCALYFYSKIRRLKSVQIGHLYRGPAFSNKEVLQEIKIFGYKHKFYKDIETKIAQLLTHNNVVMRFKSKMEYGPRALGNRSILYPTNDKSVNDWLNMALRRSEFMPFAPATLKEAAAKCYKRINGRWNKGLFMTITFDCTYWMKKVSPGVVHVDGTARPQLVTKNLNQSFYKILKIYHRLTGIPSLINTSFNMHEEPIVCTPKDSLRAFKDSGLKYLAIENYLVTNENDDVLFFS